MKKHTIIFTTTLITILKIGANQKKIKPIEELRHLNLEIEAYNELFSLLH